MSDTGLFEPFESAPITAHRLLLASAGTGKTFQLANHFAGLLAIGVGPEKILATTFTRKAAGEILDRVLQRLSEAASASSKGEETRGFLRETAERVQPGSSELITAGHCRAVLAGLLRSIDRFQVRTLDSFFVRLARLFAFELEIAPEWRITDDVEERALVAEGVARVLEGLGLDEQLELVRGVVTNAGARQAADALVQTIQGADELSRTAEPDAWRQIQPLERPSPEAMERAMAAVRTMELPKVKSGKADSRWQKQQDLYLAAFEGLDPAGDRSLPESLMTTGFGKAVLSSEPKYYDKPIPEDAVEAVLTLLHQWAALEIEGICERNLAAESLLEKYFAADSALRAETGAYRFGDFPRALLRGPARAPSEIWLSDLGYRLDARLDHLLLDEFQDTAPSQWRLLEPLAEEVLSEADGGRSFFCVGDVKQSIYGWRGAEPRLLGRMDQRYPVLKPESLVRSYRSSQVVLDTVNLTFEGISARPALAGEERDAVRAAAETWESGFQPHVSAREDLLGESRLWVAPKSREGEQAIDPSVALAVDRVVDLSAQHPGASIALLVRARKNIARLRFLLGARGIEASDEGGNPLTDAAGVTWILALLQLADHPGDGIARLQVARSPFAQEFGLDPSGVETEEGRRCASLAARRIRGALTHGGYGAFCERWAGVLTETASEWDLRRLEQLVELSLAYDERAGLRPMDFVEYVRAQRVPDPTASRVKVMTIHASKGLEFDIVILPELGKEVRLTPDSILSEAPDEASPPSLLTVKPRKPLLTSHPQLSDLYGAAQQRAMTDGLSTLYVAMTRAVHVLELIVPHSKERKRGLQHGTLLFPGVAGGSEVPDTSEEQPTLAWTHPDSSGDWTPKSTDERAFVPEPELNLGASPGSGSTVVLRPSSGLGFHGERGDGSGDSTGRRVGVLLHAMLQGVEWRTSEAPSDEALRAACLGADPAMDAPVTEAITRLRAAWESDALTALLTRADGETRVWNERSFDVEVTDLDGGPRAATAVARGVIDRLVLHMVGDAVQRVEVVDYKTESAAGADSVLWAHREQLLLYRDAATRLFGLQPEAVKATICWLPPEGEAQLIAVRD